MRITFSSKLPITRSMIFEDCYEEELRLTLDEKVGLAVSRWIVDWMLVDGELAGETYGVRLCDLKEKIEDCDGEPGESLYCYSTTLLPPFRGHNLSSILKAHWLGLSSPATVVGHATSDAAWHLNEKFGAKKVAEHESWYGTERRAIFYRLRRDG